MCVDYRDLNSPKDSFPLPNIDILVDNTAGHGMFSFMDGFSGYNQIKMAEQDQEKTAFTTQWGTFCYKVMPFGLKNAGSTYQRAMTTQFHDMMHREIEVYVDDMIAKSLDAESHIVNLRKESFSKDSVSTGFDSTQLSVYSVLPQGNNWGLLSASRG